ncbi:hypothetical protein OIU78_029459 [Salix suchowensis]|nr:hypothetical protein OIU78_029459 [Salix suchowensis]
MRSSKGTSGLREARGEGTSGLREARGESVSGTEREARDERVMCLVWGRGCWVVESRDEGRERHTRRRVEEMSRGSQRREKGDEGPGAGEGGEMRAGSGDR